jgi:hypothetical protein
MAIDVDVDRNAEHGPLFRLGDPPYPLPKLHWLRTAFDDEWYTNTGHVDLVVFQTPGGHWICRGRIWERGVLLPSALLLGPVDVVHALGFCEQLARERLRLAMGELGA